MNQSSCARTDAVQQTSAPCLAAATANGNLLRFLQSLSIDSGWTFRAFLSSAEMMEMLSANEARLVVLDVFLDDQNGFDLRADIRINCENQLVPVMLVAPGCSSEQELSERLEVSRARFEVKRLSEGELAGEILDLMSDSAETAHIREHFRYSTFLQATGEICHAANQPLTALICNLELAMHNLKDEALKQRLKVSHDSALKIVRIIQKFQQSKRAEEKNHLLPIYMLNRQQD